ncbi:MAG TPA: HD domain-containing phosphohydrolase [Gemmatimonadaceae bacterium]|nr:HD domain-containing phosphohydrolase [Gemmatimonadaceae bacterium]
MRPARPVGGYRGDLPALRLVGVDATTAFELIEQARLAEDRGRVDLARDLYERALLRARSSADASIIPVALLASARVANAAGDAPAALDILDAALASAMARASDVDCARAAALRSRVLWGMGDVPAAEAESTRARDWARRAGDVREAADALRTLGALAFARGAVAESTLLYEECVGELRAIGHVRGLSATLAALAELYDDARRWDASDATFTEAASVASGLGDPAGVVDAIIRHAELLARRGDIDRAQSASDRAIEAARRLRDPRAAAVAARTAAMVARLRGDFARAEERLVAAETVVRDHPDAILSAEIAAERAELFQRQDRHRETIVALNRAYRALSQQRSTAAVVDVARRARRLEVQFIDVVRRWGQSIEAKDLNTHGHCERVADLACAIATRMGVGAQALFWYRVGALLHDIGKLVVPAELLNKPGRLSEDEWALVRRHPIAGAEMLADVDFPWDVRPIVECHHECWDGSGYPHGLAGERIPLAARIVCVADVYDVLTSDRSFKRALSHDEALDVMRRDVGRQFDPAVFRAFEETIAEWTASEPGEPSADVADRRSASERAPNGAGADGLTGVLPRGAFVTAVADALGNRRSPSSTVSLVFIDVDDLSRVNEAYGQLQGDDVLWAVARVLQHGLRGGDLIGRYGGDEFAILLPGAPLEVAREVARRLQAAVARLRSPIRNDPETTMAVTISAGVASAPAHADSAEALMAAADRALFAARRNGAGALASAEEVDPRPATPRMDLDRFVGRVDEVRKLVGWLDAACRRDGRLVTIVGEAGIGKSMLVRQLEPEVRVRAGFLAVGRNTDGAVKAPFAAWTEVLTAIHQQGIVPPGAWHALARIAPALGDAAVAEQLDTSPYALLEELVAYLRVASTVRPLVIVLEDVQWADRATWDALEFVVAQLDDARVLLCATIRAEEARDVADRRRRLARTRGFAQLSLRRLSRDELKRWLETVFHQGDIGVELPTFLHRYTEGNPLLVAQVLRALVDDGGVWYAGTRWEWRAPDQMQLPPACAQLVSRRIDRLSPRAATIVANAAMLGRPFDVDMLVAVGVGSPEDITGALDEGVTAAVLVRGERQHAREFEFAHAVLAAAARHAIPDRTVPEIHRRIARALELRTPTAVADIARHYHSAGDDPEAYRYAMLAADRAASVHAHDEAAACLAVAQRHAPSSDDLAAARVRHARVAESAGRFEQAEELCDLALDHLATQPGNVVLSIAVRRVRERLRARRGQPARRTLDACIALLAQAESEHVDEEVVALHVMIAEAYGALGDLNLAERSSRRAVRLSAARGDRRGHADALLRLGASLPVGRLEERLDRYREALALFIRLGDKHGLTRCWLATGDAHANVGRLAAAREALEVALDTARQAHAPDLAAIATFALGTLDLKAGVLVRARERLDESLRLFTTVRDEAKRAAVLLALGHVAREDGRLADATSAYDAAAARANELDDECIEMAAEAGAGLAALDQRDVTGAEGRLRRADELLVSSTSHDWFAGRELVESLAIRLAAGAGHVGLAADRFDSAFTLAEPNDAFAAATLVAECAPALIGLGLRSLSATIERVRYAAIASGFDRLASKLPA